MNIFARIERLDDFQFRKVKYYSIRFEDKEENEFFDFLNRMELETDFANDLSNLLVWIEEIGEKYGAIKNRFFRNESITADVQALPPKRNQLLAKELMVENMRLYCLVLNENVVFLFNGGIKTTQTAQDCPNVSPFIKQANKIVEGIDTLIKNGSILWNMDHTDIVFDDIIEIEV